MYYVSFFTCSVINYIYIHWLHSQGGLKNKALAFLKLLKLWIERKVYLGMWTEFSLLNAIAYFWAIVVIYCYIYVNKLRRSLSCISKDEKCVFSFGKIA